MNVPVWPGESLSSVEASVTTTAASGVAATAEEPMPLPVQPAVWADLIWLATVGRGDAPEYSRIKPLAAMSILAVHASAAPATVRAGRRLAAVGPPVGVG